jgi:hypothetical protein
MMAALPVDVWSHIISWSAPQDLAQLAQVSQSFLDLVRPILYRSVALCNRKDTIRDTFNLLRRDRGLAEKIIKLRLETEYDPRAERRTWLDFDALAFMTRLTSLDMAALPFYNDREQQEFNMVLSQSCPLLKEFTYRHPRFPSGPSLGIGSQVQIAGIESFRWYASV